MIQTSSSNICFKVIYKLWSLPKHTRYKIQNTWTQMDYIVTNIYYFKQFTTFYSKLTFHIFFFFPPDWLHIKYPSPPPYGPKTFYFFSLNCANAGSIWDIATLTSLLWGTTAKPWHPSKCIGCPKFTRWRNYALPPPSLLSSCIYSKSPSP